MTGRGENAGRLRRLGRGLADSEGVLAWTFLTPSLVFIAALVGVPFFLAIAYAFSDVTTGDPSFDWAGLDNFRALWGDARSPRTSTRPRGSTERATGGGCSR